jgi:Ca-activated chloride channel family protein
MLCLQAGCPQFAPITTGGPQDIAAARQTIEDGGIPDPDSITVEGFMSEHSIPMDVSEAEGTVFATAPVAWNADFDVLTPLATIAIGLGLNVEEEAFERDPLNLCLAIDSSESMNKLVDVRSGTSTLDAVKIAIDRLLAQLDEDDRVSMVSFATESELLVEAAAGDDIAAIKGGLDEIAADGGTDLARGLRRAFRAVRAHSDGVRSDRVIVFTDAGLTRLGEARVANFLGTMREYANLGIGATILGVGKRFGYEVADAISRVRGGNYFFLSDYDRIVTVFDTEFDFLVTPVAYDVLLAVSVPFEFDVVDIYGVPVDKPLSHNLRLEIPTLFRSVREGGGAIMVRVRPGALVDFDVDNVVATVGLAYKTREGATGSQPTIDAVLPAGFYTDQGPASYFGSFGAKRAVLLLNTALVMRNACDDFDHRYRYYDGAGSGLTRGIQRLTEFLPYFDQLSEGLDDAVSEDSRTLSQERALVEELLSNIKRAR